MIDIEKLKQKHAEEVRDMDEYRQMAEENPEWARIFRDIAHDEQTHADLLEHIINHGTH